VTRRLIDEFTQRGRPSAANTEIIDVLTEREREVLALVGRGMPNIEIAGALCVSEATVESHVKRLFMKLPVRDRAQAVVVAYESGLVQPSR
jgi:DNA-binding NarL/FixJ family response regulator